MKTKALKVIFFSTISFVFFTNSNAQTTIKDKATAAEVPFVNPAKDLVVNIGSSKDHTTLLAAIKAADMVEILQSAGPFTLFAPTNAAFEMLPAGTVAALLKTENKGNLNIILKYHMVAGKLTTADILKLVESGNGTATLVTVERKNLVVTAEGNKLLIRDEKGGVAQILNKDLNQSNGVMYVIDRVLLPKEL